MNPNLEKEILKILSDSTYPLCLADLAKLMHYPEMEILEKNSSFYTKMMY